MKSAKRPAKIIQFGKGNFLRAFSVWMVEILNQKTDFNGNIEIVETFNTRKSDIFNRQNYRYHVIEKGIENDKQIERVTEINAVRGLTNGLSDFDEFLKLGLDPNLQFIISNTTEAGIEFDISDTSISSPRTFPGRLTAFLHHRFLHSDIHNKPIYVLPCELIENNANTLKHYVLKYCKLWTLSNDFDSWLEDNIIFCNTLVDRIVSGYPKQPNVYKERLSFDDELMVVCEPFHFWAIEDKAEIKKALPVLQTDLNVKFSEDIKSYKEIKVRILNGAHTAMVALGMIQGIKTVEEFMLNTSLRVFLKDMIDNEILPTLKFAEKDSIEFKNMVYDRFLNPYLKHELSAIQLNSISKFKSRLLPTFIDYIALKNRLPEHITDVLSHLILLYKTTHSPYGITLKDEPEVTKIFQKAWSRDKLEQTIEDILKNELLWGRNLYEIKNLDDEIYYHINKLQFKENKI
ncbi:MAG: tagaturonate reductase [Bacteroidetes bacterium]|jgi:tagaturonate reductase|nr:tagaturonate reductase [Bacteroidota bacterium]